MDARIHFLARYNDPADAAGGGDAFDFHHVSRVQLRLPARNVDPRRIILNKTQKPRGFIISNHSANLHRMLSRCLLRVQLADGTEFRDVRGLAEAGRRQQTED